MSTKTTEELQQELAALIAERDEIRRFLDEEVRKKESRLRDLEGRMGGGEIRRKELEIRDSAFPIYKPAGKGVFSKALRIVLVTDKTIALKSDQSDRVTRYQRANGWRVGAKQGWDAIDAPKALEIWAKFQKSKQP